jgi:nucleotide-binding universal stress UspA family protein
LVITGRQAHVERARSLEIGIIGDVLMGVRTPLLIPGDDDAVFDPFGPAVIAWNDSYEAANAVRNAVGLLKLSSDVRVIQLTDIEDEPPTHLLEYLSRHDIHAQVDTWIREDAVEDSLTDYAQQRAASYIVMGGYGHNRAGEFLFGGVTRSLLKASPVALALAH